MNITERVGSVWHAIASALGSVVVIGHLSGAELLNVLVGNAGTWFTAIAVGGSQVVPYVSSVVHGQASTAQTVTVVAGAGYVAILLHRLLSKIGRKVKES